SVLRLLRARGWIIVSMDEAVERIAVGRSDRPFAVLTFDDGYRDNLEWALPIMEREKTPFMLYAVPGFLERSAPIWWKVIEEAIRRADRLSLRLRGVPSVMETATEGQKQHAALRIGRALREAPQAIIAAVTEMLAQKHAVDVAAITESLCFSIPELQALARHPLATIGAHTMTHPMLASLPPEIAEQEMSASKRWIEACIGQPVRHFAYPVGKKHVAGPREFALAEKAGFTTAVTTRPGMIFAEHAAHVHALPRLSLNGRYQTVREVDTLLSGLPFALWNSFRKVNVG
ncbi:MAG: polysaccharide deacetylase family protein, partial [Beijerinckiaceae bacterium]